MNPRLKRVLSYTFAVLLGGLLMGGGSFLAWAAYTNNGADAQMTGGRDSSGNPRTFATDTSGDILTAPASGGAAQPVIGTTPQGTAKGNELQTAGIVFETTPTTLSNNQTGPAEADNKGRTIVVGAAAIAAAAAGSPVQVGSQDINGNIQVPNLDFSGQNYTALFAGVGQDAPYGMSANGYDFGASGKGTVRAVPITLDTESLTSTPRAIPFAGADNAATRVARIPTVVPVGSAVSGTAPLMIEGGKDASGNSITLPIPANGAATPAGGVSVQGTITDALGAAVEPDPLLLAGWQKSGGTSTINSLAAAPNATAVTLANTNGLVVAGNGNGTIYDLSVTPVGTAVTATQNVAAIGGEDDSTSGAGNAREITVATSGTAFAGTTPTVVEMGGMDSTATNGVPRVVSVIPSGSTAANTLNLTMIGATDTSVARPLTAVPVGNAPNAALNALMVGGSTTEAVGGTEYTLTVAPNATATTLANTGGLVIAGNNNGTIYDLDVVPAGTTVTGTTNLVMMGATDGAVARQLTAPLNNTAVALASTTGLVIGGNNNGTAFDLDVVPVGTAVTTTANVAMIGGEDDSVAGAGNAKAFTVATSGTAFGGTTPTALMIGGEDNTATNGVPRVMRVASATGTFNGGEVETIDASEFAPAIGAPTNTSLTSNTPVGVGTPAAGKCWQLICAVDVTYRVQTAGPAAAAATDMELPAKTTLTKCSGSATQAMVAVLPSATSSAAAPAFGGCSFAILQSPL